GGGHRRGRDGQRLRRPSARGRRRSGAGRQAAAGALAGAGVRQRSRPKLADVADRAGVSLKTASRALNGEYGVAPATAEKVLSAARELGFRAHLLRRSLGYRPAPAAI